MKHKYIKDIADKKVSKNSYLHLNSLIQRFVVDEIYWFSHLNKLFTLCVDSYAVISELLFKLKQKNLDSKPA